MKLQIALITFFFLAFLPGYSQDLKQLRNELSTIYKEDQAIRKAYVAESEKTNPMPLRVDSLANVMQQVDSMNLIKVSNLLDKYGWLGEDKVGSQGNTTLFLVIQHSGLEAQEKYLPMMRKAVNDGNALKSDLALLEDRVALGQGKLQIYGSQVGYNQDTKQWHVLPLADPNNVDKRRAKVGLEPLSEYIKTWGMKWNVDQYKKDLPEIKRYNGFKD